MLSKSKQCALVTTASRHCVTRDDILVYVYHTLSVAQSIQIYLLLILTCFEFNINLFRNSAVYIIRFIETVTSQVNRKVRVGSTYSDWFMSQGFGAFDFELASIPSSAQQNTAEP